MKRVFKWLLISIVSLCVIVVIAGYVLVKKIDFNAYKDEIISAVYDLTGRQLKIGNIEAVFSFRPTIEIQNVTLSNAKWAKTPDMVVAEKINVSVNILPLLAHNYELSNLTVKNMVLNLEENAKGEKNWDMMLADGDKVQQKAEFSLIRSAYAEELDENQDTLKILSAIVIKNVELDNIKLNYTDQNAKMQTYHLHTLTLAENADDNIDFTVNVNNGTYAGKGSLGALSLLRSRDGYPIEANLSMMGIKVKTKAQLFDILGNLKFDGNVEVSEFLGNKYKENLKVKLVGGLDKVTAKIEKLKLAENEIKGDVNVELNLDVPTINVKLNSEKIDVASFEQKTAYNFSLIKNAHATKLVPETLIPYKELYSVKANAELNVAKIVKNKDEIGRNFVVNANVDKGIVVVDIVRGQIVDGTVRAGAKLNAEDKSLLIDADINNLNLKKLTEVFKITSESLHFKSGTNTDIYVNLIGTGDTFTQVVDSLNGQAVVIVDETQMHLGNVGLIKGNILSQLLNTLSLTKGNDDLDLRCAVVRADFKDGKADFPDGIVVNADKFTVVANGNVNLKKDKINISIKPFAGRLTDTNIAKALSSLVKLTGTIQKPKIGVDSANAIKTLVGVTTAGPVYLGAQMLLENDGAPCYTALQGTKFENKFPKPKNVVNQTGQDVGKIFDDSVGAVKNTTKELLNIFSGSSVKKSEK